MNNANQYCLKKAAQSGSSFYYSFLFLPPKEKQAIVAVYAFCREVDDIVDNIGETTIAEKKLIFWHDEIERVFEGTPQHPIGQALAIAIQNFSLKKQYFLEIIQGMSLDLHVKSYATFDELKTYCYYVAGTVGLLTIEIFGYQDPLTLEYARNLGLAFQLVNIIRDVGEDAARGRIYLPESELKQFSVSKEDIFNRNYSSNFKNLMQYQANRARLYYEKAKLFLPESDQYAQRSGLMMAEIYFALLREIEKTGFLVLKQKIALTPIRKLWIAWKTNRKIRKTSFILKERLEISE